MAKVAEDTPRDQDHDDPTPAHLVDGGADVGMEHAVLGDRAVVVEREDAEPQGFLGV